MFLIHLFYNVFYYLFKLSKIFQSGKNIYSGGTPLLSEANKNFYWLLNAAWPSYAL